MVRFNNVTFFYPAQASPVFEGVTAQFGAGWTGVSGDNGAGKTTLLLLAAGIETPSFGTIDSPIGANNGAGVLYCPQRTDEPPGGFGDFFYSGDKDAALLASRLDIGADFAGRWDTLSHGERKRVQLAVALWKNPPFLAVDEPTNHLDARGRSLIAAGLEGYGGAGLLVSHDRALMDRLCGSCFFIRGGRGTLRPGGVSRGLVEEERERLELGRRRENLAAERGRLAGEMDRRRRDAESSTNRLSLRRVDPKDHDTRGKLRLARLSGKDTRAGRLLKNMRGRVARLDKTIDAAPAAGERKRGVRLAGVRAKADRLYYSPAGSIPLGDGPRRLSFPELAIYPGDRIALAGPNGAGKSTLITHIIAGLPARTAYLYIPQEIGAARSAAILGEVLREDGKTRGEIMARVSRLGSDPAPLLRSRLPSPGEVRKLMIARGVFTQPALVIMDEPANHLDLSSLRLLEEMLAPVPSAMLLVSHDEVFLSKLTTTSWNIDGSGQLGIG